MNGFVLLSKNRDCQFKNLVIVYVVHVKHIPQKSEKKKSKIKEWVVRYQAKANKKKSRHSIDIYVTFKSKSMKQDELVHYRTLKPVGKL